MIRHFSLQTAGGNLLGQLTLPEAPGGGVMPGGLILFPCIEHAELDQALANALCARGHAILSMDLLSSAEGQFPDTAHNIPRLTQRLIDVLRLIERDADMQDRPLGIYAQDRLTPVALRAAALHDARVRALACRAGLVDQAGLQALKLLAAPLFMLFAASDTLGQTAWQRARPYLNIAHETEVFPDETASLAAVDRLDAWFSSHFNPAVLTTQPA